MTPRQHRDAHARLMEILGLLPAWREILTAGGPLAECRRTLEAALLNDLLRRSGNEEHCHPLDWVLARESVALLMNLLMPRHEELVGFSMLDYLCRLAQPELDEAECAAMAVPSAGFFGELEHLLLAATGRSGIYDAPSEPQTDLAGREAAVERSRRLSELAGQALAAADAVPCGLDTELARRRSRNRQRIMSWYGATDVEWEDWRWHLRHTIRDADTLGSLVELSPAERQAIDLAREQRIPFGVTPYYASLMEVRARTRVDRTIRAQVIPSLHYVESTVREQQESEGCLDFMLERDTSPIDGITRRYPMICILKPVLTCPQICVYCQRNWQIGDVDSAAAWASASQVEAAIHWIAETPAIREVLITGGDPLILSDNRLRTILNRLAHIKHVERIRIGTRTPVTLPQRLTDALVRILGEFHLPGKREILVVTHFEHPTEITPQAMEAVQKLRRAGISVYNQLVYTYFTSRRFEACALRSRLRAIGVTPYYTFNTKGKEETSDFRVPIARLLQEQKEENRLFPGSLRTDEIVFNVPRLGKNYLRAGQHHGVIGILPDGRRVYEFHPWEKKIARADTYVYTDVAIQDYLDRLAADGEDPDAYRTIWYYY